MLLILSRLSDSDEAFEQIQAGRYPARLVLVTLVSDSGERSYVPFIKEEHDWQPVFVPGTVSQSHLLGFSDLTALEIDH